MYPLTALEFKPMLRILLTFLYCCYFSVTITLLAEEGQHTTDLRVFVLPHEITNSERLAAAIASDVRVVRYMKDANLEDILRQIEHVAEGQLIDRLALAFHGKGNGHAAITKHAETTFNALLNDHNLRQFWQQLGQKVRVNGAIDLLTCSFTNGNVGSFAHATLADITGRVINASDDITGNGHGNDWFLEQGVLMH